MTLSVSKKQVGAFFLALLMSGALFVPSMTQAKLGLDEAKTAAKISNDGKEPASDIGGIVGKIIKAVIGLLGIISIVLTVYAGFLWMTARGETAQVDKAKSLLVQSVIGMAII